MIKLMKTLVITMLLTATNIAFVSAFNQFGERTLRIGSTGEDVRSLQVFLNDNGFVLAFEGPGSYTNETDYFGPLTRDALIRYQSSNLSGIKNVNLGDFDDATIAHVFGVISNAVALNKPSADDAYRSTIVAVGDVADLPNYILVPVSGKFASSLNDNDVVSETNFISIIPFDKLGYLKGGGYYDLGEPVASGDNLYNTSGNNLSSQNLNDTTLKEALVALDSYFSFYNSYTSQQNPSTYLENVSYLAQTAPSSFSLSVISPSGGIISGSSASGNFTCPSTCRLTVPNGDSVTLTATPVNGYRFATWGSACSGFSGACRLVFNSNKDLFVSAIFSRLTATGTAGSVTHSITVTPSTGGRVVGGAIDCPSLCQASLLPGSSIKYTAVPSSGYVFAGWTGECATASTSSCVVYFNKNANISAIFTQETVVNSYSLVVEGDHGGGSVNGGGISCPSTCTTILKEGESVTLYAEPSSGYKFKSWEGACKGDQNNCQLTLTTNASVTATFSLVEAPVPDYTLTVNQSPVLGGKIDYEIGQCNTSSCSIVLKKGSSLILDAIADTGYEFDSWKGCSSLSGSACIVNSIQSNTSVTVKFNPKSNCATFAPGHDTSGSSKTGYTFVDNATIPCPNEGSSQVLLYNSGQKPYYDYNVSTGAFRTVCRYSHFNYDDPVRLSGQRNASHLNIYVGNGSVNRESTVSSVTNVGNSTCRGGIVDRSSYYFPAMVDSRNGAVLTPDAIHIYYKSGFGVDPLNIKTIPKGLTIVSGDLNNSSAKPWEQSHSFWCSEKSGWNWVMPDCPKSDSLATLEYRVIFPQCWDGVNLDSADHKSHMAKRNADNKCPSSHPVMLPEISINARYKIPSSGDTSFWRLTSDKTSNLPGTSGHATWVNGWRGENPEEYIPDIWTKEVLNKGLSAGSHIIGDGRIMCAYMDSAKTICDFPF